MTPARAIAAGHSGSALQLETFLESQSPGQLANVQGIFIDWDMGAGVMIQDCASWISESLPAGAPPPPGMAGATKPCMFVPANLNPQALAFNTTGSPTIGGKTREEWRIATLQVLTHEIQHRTFDTAAHTTPPGITTATCTRAELLDTLSWSADDQWLSFGVSSGVTSKESAFYLYDVANRRQHRLRLKYLSGMIMI